MDVPDSLEFAGRLFLLHARPECEWAIEDDAGHDVGTLIASDPDLGDPEWYVVDDVSPEPDGYWPSWRAALEDALDYQR